MEPRDGIVAFSEAAATARPPGWSRLGPPRALTARAAPYGQSFVTPWRARHVRLVAGRCDRDGTAPYFRGREESRPPRGARDGTDQERTRSTRDRGQRSA